ncbi:MAG TPA: tRNA (N(6)-L-threonylcarbamoyladenosine(37)-C(2))-methylthiotransferase [Methanospirillum sp.]|uniref:tRNA (N(6)-L-threonylcarbamoyladenosine(37)-C(2))- methylthiotransferase n=1 Tax=Methanospirillum sp. TaxID=45200 RepID=UPI002C8A47C2|nr:tRNA (N(6)-L-threonylcarbamoyladenosine(37)-C(2))-methylthiotransferase [Methanospirillum sp.]HWQ64242.1 tRNA (N(6)-L-threonylcarbamoyladenosine(37)-C(2))-methylthiotransferase [Methanospirillum sp.]
MDEKSGESLSYPPWVQALSGQKICILTFGCTYNEGDSDRLKHILTRAGSLLVEDPQDADAVILNTCIVIEKTERKMIRLLKDLEGKEIWVTGCLPTARAAILNEFPAVRILSPDSIHAVDLDHNVAPSGPVAVVQIGSGCLGHCTYCITRHARGRIKSNPIEEIISQIRAAVQGGAVEIRLTGQDLSAYGYDWGTPSLHTLLLAIGEIKGTFFVRLGMMNPATLLPIIHEVADALDNDHIFSFVHLPVQSGSDQVLKRMGREYNLPTYLMLVDALKKKNPDISIATDVITGFVAESEDEFKETCELLVALQPDALNVTRYSYRPGSTAPRVGELPDRIKKDRSRELIRIGYAILKTKKVALVGRTEEVVITEKLREGTVMGRTRSYTGIVIAEDLLVGSLHMVEFTGERTQYLTGRVIRSLY